MTSCFCGTCHFAVALSTWIPFGVISSAISIAYTGRQSNIIRLDSTSSVDDDSMVFVCIYDDV